ncbi:ribonuclease H-like domain-containing protein [Sporolactobacillus sp. CPB3-1]|uniref:Ribonuclease H-like domain-containing protein n=1 Tax=Sporolactobacillus mangiferae TaxID=2940498 RepID=A0ABT0MA54_9BACL|nr:ribonuclease H-like domain-containing protein [Sporolactobacillus mangiferae]MCL1631745.1 ribonuclease H-like domain-containing protein [Sporolactobacillus mangiferae]
MSLTKKLQLYRKQLHEQNQLTRPEVSQSTASFEMSESRQNEAIAAAAQLLNAKMNWLDDQYVLVYSEIIPIQKKVGPYTLAELDPAVSAWQSFSPRHPLSACGLQTEELLFFDTETTGLGSGAGQMIFLIGLAHWTRQGVVLNQYFLPGPGHEAAFYHKFLNDTKSLKNLVTFNGKAFDWPRVKTRHQFVRNQVPRLPAFGHFDLLHASRRLWKNRLEAVRLQTIESDILSMERTHDVPGKMAPFLYFRFLKHPDAGLVKGIMEHNRDDVLTLISLYIHLSNKIMGRIGPDLEEKFEIARWNDQIGETDRAQRQWEALVHQPSSFRGRAKLRLAQLYKKQGAYSASLNLLQSAIRDPDVDVGSIYIEAAKLLEHQFKDYRRAQYYTKEALNYLYQGDHRLTEGFQSKEADYLKRLQRLNGRIGEHDRIKRNITRASAKTP